MSQKPRGRNDPRQAWGNQSGGGGGGAGGGGNGGNGGNRRPPGQNPPNFADSNAFGPPLGGRARPNRQGGEYNKLFRLFHVHCLQKHGLLDCYDIMIIEIAWCISLSCFAPSFLCLFCCTKQSKST